MKRRMASWFGLWTDYLHLGFEAQTVVGLRLMKIASGGAAAEAETRLMVMEKSSAAADALKEIALSLAARRGDRTPTKLVRLYRRRVRANRKRLTRRS